MESTPNACGEGTRKPNQTKPNQAYLCTTITLAGPSRASHRTACQPSGSLGSVKSKSHRPSAGDTFRQPPLTRSPQASCQYAAWMAWAPRKFWTQGTSECVTSSGPSIVAVANLPVIGNWPTGVEDVSSRFFALALLAPPRPAATKVVKTGRVPSYAMSQPPYTLDSTQLLRFGERPEERAREPTRAPHGVRSDGRGTTQSASRTQSPCSRVSRYLTSPCSSSRPVSSTHASRANARADGDSWALSPRSTAGPWRSRQKAMGSRTLPSSRTPSNVMDG